MTAPRQAVPIGTNQSPWKLGLPKGLTQSALCTNSAAPDPSVYAHIVPTAKSAVVAGTGAESQASAKPVERSHANGVYPVAIPELSNRLNLKFYVSDGDNETGAVYLFGLRRLSEGTICEWVGDYLCSATFQAGQKAVNTSSQMIPSKTTDGDSVRWADTITPADDSFDNSAEVFSDTAEGAAVLSIDSFGYEVVVVVLCISTAEGVGFIWNTI